MRRRCFLILFVVALAGCSSVKLPPALTAEEQSFVRTHRTVDAVILVKEDSMYPANSQKLYETLKRMNLFREVVYNKPGCDAEYTVELKWRDYHTNTPQFMVTFVTFGIIPSWKKEEHGVNFALETKDAPKKVKNVEVVWSGTTLKGWLMLFANMSSGRSSEGPYESERYRERLKLEILKVLYSSK